MKKSRIAKLALLGASTLALAGTLSTSTYAWYVSNKTASVNQATGSTASATTDGSILLSWTGNDNKWWSELKWDESGHSAAADTTGAFANSLTPVHWDATNSKFVTGRYYVKASGTYDSSATYYTRSAVNTYAQVQTNDEDAFDAGNYYVLSAGADAQSSTYISFSFYIKGTTAVSITPTITFANTTSAANILAAKTPAYVPTGTGDNAVAKNSMFVVDALNALYYSVKIGDGAYKYGNAEDVTDVANTVKPADAHTFYEAASGEGVYYTAPDAAVTTAGNQFGTFTCPTTSTLVTVTIWLEGGDVDCYNSCALQDFSIDLSFKA